MDLAFAESNQIQYTRTLLSIIVALVLQCLRPASAAALSQPILIIATIAYDTPIVQKSFDVVFAPNFAYVSIPLKCTDSGFSLLEISGLRWPALNLKRRYPANLKLGLDATYQIRSRPTRHYACSIM